ncbi:MAG: hypothetical protein HKN21_03685 [Candidatus Eisenbacteria bacterium]|uniref:Flavodoxin-like fold domain-containing protein n=1 Tax=Eiseniibacteriota bacterium TaxID=2212470 RepID=A0A7Y2E7K8_UNCEI|nr:hypothetical protein [Candidatus Eisenbacteria bacterium]
MAEHRVLILFAHPMLQRSRTNRKLIRGILDIEGVTFHDLYEEYPDFNINVQREQALLLEHDVFLLQHPFYWYSTPALLKEWQDLVLEHGWAYGREGTALHGKIASSVVTAGGSEEAYRPGGMGRYEVRRLLAPIEQTFKLCGVRYLAPFVVHGTHGIDKEGIEKHAADYQSYLKAMTAGSVDFIAAEANDLPFVNQDLNRVIRVEA